VTDTGPPRPNIAVFSGPDSTIQNTPPLVTSNLARRQYGLPERRHADGGAIRFDALRPQRLAAPVTVYIEQFSAHPLERDAAPLYAPPDGYLDKAGDFHAEPAGPDDIPVYRVTLRPEDGLYPLPYMARQVDGRAWDDETAEPFAPKERSRQSFYPDASRMFEEIDRFGLGADGVGGLLAARADFDFYRAAPSGGYTRGLDAHRRTDVGSGDISAERLGEDFFPYRPFHLQRHPTRAALARLTNVIQRALASGWYAGGIWLDGSPNLEETCYWLNLLIDASVPIVGNASQRPHGMFGNDGDRNIVDAVEYLASHIWADDSGCDRVGVVVIQDGQIFTSREVQKGDARPGGYVAAGGHGGIVGRVRDAPDPPVLTFLPTRLHTHSSEVHLTRLPSTVPGVRRGAESLEPIDVQVRDERGDLLAQAMPAVHLLKIGQYRQEDSRMDVAAEVELEAWLEHVLETEPLAGLVAEGMAPYGITDSRMDLALRRVVQHGIPVVRVGRGNADGFTQRNGVLLGGNNLSATKARMLLMAGLLRYGMLPHASSTECEAALASYQALFDSH
jgi:L-asparaginase